MLRIHFLFFFFFTVIFSQTHAQNISVNTTGASNTTNSMFEVLQPSTTSGTSGLFVRHSGATTTAYGLWVEMTGAVTNKYAIIVPNGSGSVGIGTSTPSYKLDVQNGSLGVGTLYGPYVMYGTLGSFDTRATNPWPETYNMGVTSEFKANGSNGLADGGAYNSVLSVRQWSSATDWSGGGVHQLGFTQNGNIWHRYSQTTSTWGAWNQLLTTGSNGYIKNQTTLQSSANYNISGSGNVQTSFQLQGTNAIFGNANDIYANIRVIQNNSSTLQDGMYVNYNSTGGAAAHLKFYANGTTERMRIDASTGNVGINTTSPNMKLEVNSGTGDGIVFGQQADNTNTIQTFIDGQWTNRATYAGGCCNALAIQPDVGVVGIGTLSPGQKLDVRGNITIPNNGSLFLLPEISANTAVTGVQANNGQMSDGLPWYGGWSRESGAWVYPYPDYVLSNHTGIRLAAHGNYGGIAFYDQYNWGTGLWSSSGTEIARIKHNNYGGSYFLSSLGIGTTTPSTSLHVAGNFRLVDGTQGSGKVLTSDASGNASWSNTSTLMQVFTNAASQTNINSTFFIDVIGLSRTITTTVPCYFIINTTGSLESQGTSGTWTGTITALDRGGVSLTEQGNDIINTGGINYVVTHWGINYTEALPAGTYTYKVKCRYYNGTAYFYAGGATTTGLSSDGTMTIQVVPQ